ncbi:MAG TPA: hypothetical protein VLM85_10190 [Polyangiaceae bacterium]|nr:hypothetical protein [Polyangiaceae bacterium]
MAGRFLGSSVGIACVLFACGPPGETVASGKPPAPPGDGSSPTSQTRTFAMRTVLLGDTHRNGVAAGWAWQDYGFDIDDHYTTKYSLDTCRLTSGAPISVQVDGSLGVDNSWGASVLRQLQPLMQTSQPSQLASSWIAQGKGTLEIVVTGLSDVPRQRILGLTAQVFRGGVYPGAPAFDLSTSWPVLASSLADGQSLAGGAATAFANAYSTDGVFVSGATDGVIVVDLGVAGDVPLSLTIHHPILALTLDADGSRTGVLPTDALAGILAGVLDPDEVRDAWMKVQSASKLLCADGIDAASLKQELSQDQDIFSDGTNGPPGMCSGISIGLGFTVARVANPTEVQADPQPPPPCSQ